MFFNFLRNLPGEEHVHAGRQSWWHARDSRSDSVIEAPIQRQVKNARTNI
jgi:hypothetical protein